MKGIQIFNAVAMAAAASFASTIGVVTLLYAIYLDSVPRLREDWPLVVTTFLVFCVLFLLSVLAFHAHRREKAWRWPAEAVLLLGIFFGGGILYRALL